MSTLIRQYLLLKRTAAPNPASYELSAEQWRRVAHALTAIRDAFLDACLGQQGPLTLNQHLAPCVADQNVMGTSRAFFFPIPSSLYCSPFLFVKNLNYYRHGQLRH